MKRLSSFRPEGQKRPGLAEAGRFRSTRLRGCWRGKDRPRAPQTEVGPLRLGICTAKKPLVELRTETRRARWANPARATQWRAKARPQVRNRPVKATPPDVNSRERARERKGEACLLTLHLLELNIRTPGRGITRDRGFT